MIKLLGTALDLRHAKPKTVPRPLPGSGPRFDERRIQRRPQTAATSCPTLLDLPILKCWPLDAGRFITLPCVVTRDPDTGAAQRRHVPHAGF